MEVCYSNILLLRTHHNGTSLLLKPTFVQSQTVNFNVCRSCYWDWLAILACFWQFQGWSFQQNISVDWKPYSSLMVFCFFQNYIARFGHGSAKLAKQAQSKEKTLKKMVDGGLAEKVTVDKVGWNDLGKYLIICRVVVLLWFAVLFEKVPQYMVGWTVLGRYTN